MVTSIDTSGRQNVTASRGKRCDLNRPYLDVGSPRWTQDAEFAEAIRAAFDLMA
jgi:hypothetical protein